MLRRPLLSENRALEQLLAGYNDGQPRNDRLASSTAKDSFLRADIG